MPALCLSSDGVLSPLSWLANVLHFSLQTLSRRHECYSEQEQLSVTDLGSEVCTEKSKPFRQTVAAGMAAGAFGSHGLKNRAGMTPDKIHSWETASHYTVSQSFLPDR